MIDCRHDLKAWSNWKIRCADRESSVYHADLQFRMDKQAEAQRQARSLFEQGRDWMCALEILTTPPEVNAKIRQVAKKLESTFKLPVHVVVVCNWSSLSLVASAAQKTMSSLMGSIVNANESDAEGRNIGVMLEPTHSYTKGQLWKQEEACHKHLVNGRMNFDSKFVLPFLERADDRDQRSMIRHGRVLLPMDEEAHQRTWQTWKASQILSKGLLDESHVLSAKDYLTIEDCSEDALPSTTSLTHTTNPAEKSVQLGTDGMHSLLRGLLNGLGGKPMVLVVDLFPHTGDLGRASLREKFKPSCSLAHLHYMAFHENQTEAGVEFWKVLLSEVATCLDISGNAIVW